MTYTSSVEQFKVAVRDKLSRQKKLLSSIRKFKCTSSSSLEAFHLTLPSVQENFLNRQKQIKLEVMLLILSKCLVMTRCNRLHLQTKKKVYTFWSFCCNSITGDKLLIYRSFTVSIAPVLPRQFQAIITLMSCSGCKRNDLTTFNYDQTRTSGLLVETKVCLEWEGWEGD